MEDSTSLIHKAERQVHLTFKKIPRIYYGDAPDAPRNHVGLQDNKVDDAYIVMPRGVTKKGIRNILLLHELRENLLFQHGYDENSSHQQSNEYEESDMQEYRVTKEEKCQWIEKLGLQPEGSECGVSTASVGPIVSIVGGFIGGEAIGYIIENRVKPDVQKTSPIIDKIVAWGSNNVPKIALGYVCHKINQKNIRNGLMGSILVDSIVRVTNEGIPLRTVLRLPKWAPLSKISEDTTEEQIQEINNRLNIQV